MVGISNDFLVSILHNHFVEHQESGRNRAYVNQTAFDISKKQQKTKGLWSHPPNAPRWGGGE